MSERMMNENKERLMKELMFGYLSGGLEGLIMDDNTRHDLCKFMDRYLMNLKHHRDVTLKNPNFQVGESSSMAMAPISMYGVMAPPMAKSGSSIYSPQVVDELQALISLYQTPKHVNPLANNSPDAPFFNSPQPTNNFQSIIPSNQIPEHVHSLANNSLNVPIFNFPQPTNNSQPMISANQIPEQVNSLGGNFLNPPSVNSPRLTDELQAMISSNQRPEHVNSHGGNFLNAPNFDSPRLTDELQAMDSSKQRPENVYSLANTSQNPAILNSPQLTNHFLPTFSTSKGRGQVNVRASNLLPSSGEEVYIPVMNQDEIYYPHQDQDQQQPFAKEMLKLGEQTGFPWMDNDNQI